MIRRIALRRAPAASAPCAPPLPSPVTPNPSAPQPFFPPSTPAGPVRPFVHTSPPAKKATPSDARFDWPAILLRAAGAGFGLLLIFAFALKIRNVAPSAVIYTALGLELMAGIALVFFTRSLSWLGLSVFLAFTGYHVVLLHYGIPACACLGKNPPVSSGTLLAVNIAAALCFAALFIQAQRTGPAPSRYYSAFQYLFIAGGGLAGLYHGYSVGSMLP